MNPKTQPDPSTEPTPQITRVVVPHPGQIVTRPEDRQRRRNELRDFARDEAHYRELCAREGL